MPESIPQIKEGQPNVTFVVRESIPQQKVETPTVPIAHQGSTTVIIITQPNMTQKPIVNSVVQGKIPRQRMDKRSALSVQQVSISPKRIEPTKLQEEIAWIAQQLLLLVQLLVQAVISGNLVMKALNVQIASRDFGRVLVTKIHVTQHKKDTTLLKTQQIMNKLLVHEDGTLQ
jgi:hypothetical protein